MTKRATLLMEAEPYSSASGFLNAQLAEELSQSGYTCDGFYRQHPVPGNGLIPLATADRIRRLRARPPADLAVYCDRGLAMHPPGRELASRTLVLFHGLMGSPASWLGTPAIDRYCVLSGYMEEVLTSLLAMPDWSRRRCLEPRAFHAVSRLTPALPCVEHPDGDPRMKGGELPEHLRRLLEGEDVIGHALQPFKADWQAVTAILLNLNGMALEHGLGRRFRLAIVEEDFAQVAQAFASKSPESEAAQAGLDAMGLTLEDVLVPVGHLSQAALFQLFRAARFGLAYNVFPEPFGFYVLESVFNGCPVYTNGIGNNRHALPPGHGLHVREGVGMAFGDVGAYAEVAAHIFEDVRAPQANAAACLRGREHILRTFTREAFSRDVEACLRRLEGPEPEPLAFETLEVQPSPLVRGMDEEGHVVSDFAHVTLEPEEMRLLGEVRGHRAGEVLARSIPQSELELLQGLFSKGVVALRPAAKPLR
ncbi:hypothetical protein JRI60_24650 [Archangium violaceum]|uniref:hypothetical protein n=1 Tax=Archangium violaceum TaxID=83451 RepID=UPI001951F738|nr:hypothetical protein [Archangium violaceum]QRO01978.1 hypothetical protein JRI60_24650 [Archangium violaceum]